MQMAKICDKFTMDCCLNQFWFLRINFLEIIGNKMKIIGTLNS